MAKMKRENACERIRHSASHPRRAERRTTHIGRRFGEVSLGEEEVWIRGRRGVDAAPAEGGCDSRSSASKGAVRASPDRGSLPIPESVAVSRRVPRVSARADLLRASIALVRRRAPARWVHLRHLDLGARVDRHRTGSLVQWDPRSVRVGAALAQRCARVVLLELRPAVRVREVETSARSRSVVRVISEGRVVIRGREGGRGVVGEHTFSPGRLRPVLQPRRAARGQRVAVGRRVLRERWVLHRLRSLGASQGRGPRRERLRHHGGVGRDGWRQAGGGDLREAEGTASRWRRLCAGVVWLCGVSMRNEGTDEEKCCRCSTPPPAPHAFRHGYLLNCITMGGRVEPLGTSPAAPDS